MPVHVIVFSPKFVLLADLINGTLKIRTGWRTMDSKAQSVKMATASEKESQHTVPTLWTAHQ